ncbi:MAG TPA: ABC transporter permease [Acetobacteraceae bacterium]|jgi:peptide/nickel transport system permease protein|nr:ABC transporter permease [Acetobacteraceae bacterium]
MAGYILRRVSEVIPTILLVLTLVFLALRVMPGDPAVAALGEFATPDAIAAFRDKLGLNDPLWIQYISFVGHALTLDFGRSMTNGTPITALLAQALPYTIILALSATLIGIIIGLPLGAVTAVKRDTAVDGLGRVFALIGFSLPDFYMGVLLLLVFSLQLGWFPMLGGGNGFVDQLHHLVLPAITLGLVMAAFVMRLTRSSLLEVLRRDYVRTARGKGVAERWVIFKHALRNALIPVTTGLGIYVLTTLSGTITVELVFSRPGLGTLLIGGVTARDYTLVQAGLVVFAFFVVGVNLLTDLLCAAIDPRIALR